MIGKRPHLINCGLWRDLVADRPEEALNDPSADFRAHLRADDVGRSEMNAGPDAGVDHLVGDRVHIPVVPRRLGGRAVESDGLLVDIFPENFKPRPRLEGHGRRGNREMEASWEAIGSTKIAPIGNSN